MKKALILIIIFSNLIVHSQVTFEKRFTIHTYSSSSSVLQLPNDSYVLLGDEKTIENNNQKDILLLKLNNHGEVLWWKNYGTDETEFGREVKQTFDKGFIIIGSTADNPNDESDVYLVKTDSSGNKLWDFSYDIKDYDAGYSIIQTSDSGYLITGESRIDIGPNSFPHLLLMRINKDGAIVWQRVFSSPIEIGESIIQISDSNYIICGTTTPNNYYQQKLLLFKTNLNGDSIWSRNYGESANYYGLSINEDYNNDLIISGYLVDTNNIDEVNSYYLKTNAIGDTIWSKEFSGIGYDISTCVETTKDGNYAFLGYGEMTEMNNKDVYLLKMSPDGDTIWTQFYGGSTTEYGLSLKETSDGGFIISGMAFDYDSLQPYGRGVYIIKTDEYGNVYNTQIIEDKNLYLEIFPNPCSEEFTIESDKPISLVEIFDMSGKNIFSHRIYAKKTKFIYHKENLESGLYIVRITNDKFISSKLLIVE